jgi:hypothetical protein
MAKWIIALAFLIATVAARAETDFLKTLPPGDFTAAGLEKLTPEELARLEAIVQRYKTGEVAVVQKQAEAKVAVVQKQAEAKVAAVQQEAAKKVTAAETKVKEMATEPAAATPGKKKPGWFMALVTLNHAGKKPESEEPLESRLVGDFRGWNGRSVFTLEDGTRWIQQNKSEAYEYSPTLHSPKVKISPAALSGFWLEIEGVNKNVRVAPLELEAK